MKKAVSGSPTSCSSESPSPLQLRHAWLTLVRPPIVQRIEGAEQVRDGDSAHAWGA